MYHLLHDERLRVGPEEAENPRRLGEKPYKKELELLVKLGIIDAFPGDKGRYDRVDSVLKMLEEAWERVKLSAKAAFSPHDDKLASLYWLKFNPRVEPRVLFQKLPLNQFELTAKASQVAWNEVIIRRPNAGQEFWKVVCNLGYVQQTFFRNNGISFITINDMHMLRRIACAADRWVPDVVNRVRAVPLELLRGRLDAVATAQPERFAAFTTRVCSFLEAHWERGINASLSTDHYHGRAGAVEDYLKAKGLS